MANFYRLIRAIVALGAFMASSCFAVIVPEATYYIQPFNGGAPLTGFASPADACGPWFASAGFTGNEVDKGYSPVPKPYGSCNAGIGASTYWGSNIGRTMSCPANSIADTPDTCVCVTNYEDVGGVCKRKNPCPEGQHEEGGACVPDNCKPDEVRVNGLCVKEPECPEGQTRVNGQCKPNGCEAGKNVGIFETSGPDSVEFTCLEKCTVRVSTKYEVTFTNSAGRQVTEYSGDGILTGGSCTGGTGGGGSPGPGGPGGDGGGGDGGGNTGGGGDTGGNNGPGGPTTGGGGGGGGTGGGGGGTGPGTGPTPGGGGGTGPTPLPGTKPPTGEPSGTGGECNPGRVRGPDGLCYPSEPTDPDGDGKCPDGYIKVNDKCVPLKPTGGGGGGGNGDGEGDGSSFGGSCMAGFVCEGDAVQCAIAREQHRRNCVMFNDPSPESLLYEANKNKTGNQTGDNPNNETVSLAGRIDTSDALGGGACISDLNVTVWGQSLTLPFSTICPSLAMLGNLLVAVSMLLAARIVTRG